MTTGLAKLARVLAAAALLLSGGTLLADNNAAAIKAAFVFNFAKFVEWPSTAFATPQSTLELCVSGAALDGRLNQLDGREAQGHPIHVRPLAGNEPPLGCHILVLGDIPSGDRLQLLQASGRNAVLTIRDSGEFPNEGGMIGLFVAANRVQFSVNLDAAHGAGLRLSSRMLQLAHSVHGGTP